MRKKTVSLIVIICSILLINACGKKEEKNDHDEKCATVTCLNGGTCKDGSCECTVGYEGVNCETISADKFVGLYEGKIESTVIDETRYVDIVVNKTASHDVIYLSEISNSDEAFKEIICEITDRFEFKVRENRTYRDFNRMIQITDVSVDGSGSIDELGLNLTLTINMIRKTELNGNKDETPFKTTITLKRK